MQPLTTEQSQADPVLYSLKAIFLVDLHRPSPVRSACRTQSKQTNNRHSYTISSAEAETRTRKPYLLRQARAYSKMHVEVSSVRPIIQEFGDSLHSRATFTIPIAQIPSPPTILYAISVKAPQIPMSHITPTTLIVCLFFWAGGFHFLECLLVCTCGCCQWACCSTGVSPSLLTILCQGCASVSYGLSRNHSKQS